MTLDLVKQDNLLVYSGAKNPIWFVHILTITAFDPVELRMYLCVCLRLGSTATLIKGQRIVLLESFRRQAMRPLVQANNFHKSWVQY